jgi:ubiquinone/menaquinone biosynthesis C-methylase UbiE
MQNKSRIVNDQYKIWASTYDKDKAEILKKDTGITLEEFTDRILENCHLKNGQKICEAGIGTGFISISVAKRIAGHCELFAIDISDSMIEKAKLHIRKESFQNIISLNKASAEHVPIKDGVFDLILCVFTIRHTNIRKTITEFIRVLKPGGRIVIVDLYAPKKWRCFPAKLFIPLFKLFFALNKKMKAENKSQLLTLDEWQDLITEIEGENIKIDVFPNIVEPYWKPGKLILTWTKIIQPV